MNAHLDRRLLGSMLLAGTLLAVGFPRTGAAQMTVGSLSVHGSAEVGVYPQPMPDTNVAK